MRQEEKLKEKVGTRVPYTVPEDYFKSFKRGVMESLPTYPVKPKPERLTAWQRIRPYVYLAAMFAGIWCMMQIFHRVTNPDTHYEDEIALAYYDTDSYDYYLSENSGSDLELQDELLTLYPSIDELKRDFYAQR